MQDGNKWGLNNEDLGLELEINDDLRLSNRGQMKKSGSLEGCSPGRPPFGSAPRQKYYLVLKKSSLQI